MDSLNNDLKNILIKKQGNIESEAHINSSMNDILNAIDTERDYRRYDNWNKLSKSLKKNILDDFIESQSEEKLLTTTEVIQLKELLFSKYNDGLLNKKSDILYNKEKRIIERIYNLKFDEEQRIYTYISPQISIKPTNKSKTNIERFIK